MEPLFTLGAGSDSLEVQRVRSVLWAPDASLYVADVGARRVRAFDSLGRHREDIGRDGAGPAEYASPWSLAMLGDTLAVLDVGNARFGLFRGDGTWAGSMPAQRISGPTIRLHRVPPNEVYAYGVTIPTSARLMRSMYVRYDAHGPRDTVFLDTTKGPAVRAVTCNGSDKGIHFFSTPWDVRRFEEPGPRGSLLSGMNDVYRIVQRGSKGDTVAVFAGTAEAVPITDAEWDAAGKELRDYLAADAGAQCDARSLTRPASKPAYRALFWSSGGELWVERFTPAGFNFDVFDSTGRQMGTLVAPERVEQVEPHVFGDRLVLVSENNDGAHLVRAYRIRRPR